MRRVGKRGARERDGGVVVPLVGGELVGSIFIQVKDDRSIIIYDIDIVICYILSRIINLLIYHRNT
jgi:hypothetical protein